MTIKIPDKWSQPNELWHQKTFYTEAGRPNYTYHFKSQAEHPSKVFEIETVLTKQICGYELLKKDLRDIADFYVELKQALEDESLRTRTNLQKAIVRSLVVTYGKCFAAAEGRKTKLNSEIIPNELIELHKYLIDMRNGYVAHAGESTHESCKYVLVIPPSSSFKYAEDIQYGTFVEMHQAVNIEIIFKDDFQGLIKNLLDYVSSKIISLEKKVFDELNNKLKNNFLSLYEIEPEKNRSVLRG